MAIVNPLAFLPTTPGQGVSILFGAAQIRGDGKSRRVVLDTFPIDCTVNESIELEADITEFEIEAGANINDHRRKKPVELSIAGIISDTPIDKSLIAEAIRLAAGPLNIAVDAFHALTSVDASISGHAFDKLVDLYNNGSQGTRNPDGSFNPLGSIPGLDGTLTVSTSRAVYPNMAIKSLRFTRDAKTGKALAFTVGFKQIRTVETASSVIVGPPILQGARNLGQVGAKQGPAFNFDVDTVGLMNKLSGGKFTQAFPTPSGPK